MSKEQRRDEGFGTAVLSDDESDNEGCGGIPSWDNVGMQAYLYANHVPRGGNGEAWLAPYIVFRRLSHEAYNNGMGNMYDDAGCKGWTRDVDLLARWAGTTCGAHIPVIHPVVCRMWSALTSYSRDRDNDAVDGVLAFFNSPGWTPLDAYLTLKTYRGARARGRRQ